MANTKTIIVSNSLALLGRAPIVTLDEPDDITLAASQAYDLLLPGVLSENNWRFATQISQLSESTEVPPSPYSTIYILPAGYLKNLRLYPNISDYDIYQEKRLYTGYSGTLQMEYVFQPDAAYLPPRFVKYFIYEIACHLALSNAQKPEFYNVLEGKRREAFAMAAAIEAQNRPNYYLRKFPVLTARFSGEYANDFEQES